MKNYVVNNYLIIECLPDLDGAHVKAARDLFESATDGQYQGVLVDMSGTRLIDSSGIGALVFLYKRLKTAKRALALIGLQGQPATLLKRLGFLDAVPEYGSLAAFMSAPNCETAA